RRAPDTPPDAPPEPPRYAPPQAAPDARADRRRGRRRTGAVRPAKTLRRVGVAPPRAARAQESVGSSPSVPLTAVDHANRWSRARCVDPRTPSHPSRQHVPGPATVTATGPLRSSSVRRSGDLGRERDDGGTAHGRRLGAPVGAGRGSRRARGGGRHPVRGPFVL